MSTRGLDKSSTYGKLKSRNSIQCTSAWVHTKRVHTYK